eukprot:jgi/Mesen1/9357/ME000061S08806
MASEVEERMHLQPDKQRGAIDPRHGRFPYCLVWTPLPVVAWLVPFIGHLGICREDGVILDYAGSYFINVDNFTFGSTARYIRLNPEECCFPPNLASHTCKAGFSHVEVGTALSWDDALKSTMRHFQNHVYNIFTCNCHSFVASCLNTMAYKGHCHWNIVDLAVMMISSGSWVSSRSVMSAFLPFLVVVALGVGLIGSSFLVGWAMFATLLTGWYLTGTYGLKDMIRIHPHSLGAPLAQI